MKKIIILIACVMSLRCLNKVQNDSRLESVTGTFYDMNLNSLTTYFGVSSKHSKNQTNFDVQLNLQYVIIGNRDSVNWGIDCQADKEDVSSTCQFDKVNSSSFFFSFYPNLLDF
jgi:hypothetical protein